MSKQTRKEKQEEEKRIIAEMESALEQKKEKEKKDEKACYGEDLPETLHCKRCKTELKNGVCPVCGFHIYVPMEKKKRDKIRRNVTIVSIVIFVILFLMLKIKNG